MALGGPFGPVEIDGCDCGICQPHLPSGIWWRKLIYRWRMWLHRNNPKPVMPPRETRL